MKYEAVAQFTVTGGTKAQGVINLLERYGIDYVVLNTSGTGIFSTISYEFAILKPGLTEITPDKMFSFMMKFDEMVRIGKSTHSLTPAQIDLAKSCDKAKLLKFLNDMWYQVKVSYVKIIAMLAQAYAIAYDKPEPISNEKSGSEESESPISMEILIGEFKKTSQMDAADMDRFDKIIKILPDDMINDLIQIMHYTSMPINPAGTNHGDEKNKAE